MKKRILSFITLLAGSAMLFAEDAAAASAASAGAMKYLAAAIAVGLAEGICLWGMLVGVLILFK